MEHFVELKDFRAEPYSLFFAIAYNYRQAVELRLKDVIDIGNRLYSETETTKAHDLQHLWPSVRHFAELFQPNCDPQNLNNFEALLYQLANADPKSDGFRYHLHLRDSRLCPSERIPCMFLISQIARSDC